MASRNIIILAVAAALGLLAIFLINSWFTSVDVQQEKKAQANDMVRVVVARQELQFGSKLTPENLRLVSWPRDSVPVGAFDSVDKLVAGNHVALRPITIGEPVLADRVSGVNGRATISANIPKDLRAVSIPITAVTGVSGFVTSGDVVDIMLTRQLPGNDGGPQNKMTSVLLENVQVIGINQRSSENETEPMVGDTATVLVDQYGAQRLVLAQQTGTLSLALRNVEDQSVGQTRAVTARDLGAFRSGAAPVRFAASRRTVRSRTPRPPASVARPIMTVVRGTEQSDYEVKRYAGW
ncbi:Flp pilus assembly protein CpaB [Novosphingobium mangrovi (ex Huang et al. 2023)]|uniref:Flp pilus assembly protein CpaB n=1 Tax=Novosphingobium mangrovi (ex Huang et al. 2023) TaxID=2976432 RepID=A0ABT2I5H3_9SPHN|nr:Flp pilus assembly protein CpaB [Novosphingobium mangrovi (ex Huang et al. 2023)]MCT2400058.1 Flp pilus assembly protein CpaB [Novosphingobium mangrovi (ex Huang et al. 2023)]